MATDGEHLYVTYPYWVNPAYEFEKYTMEGELVESFNLEGLNNALCLMYDGNSFYCNNTFIATTYGQKIFTIYITLILKTKRFSIPPK